MSEEQIEVLKASIAKLEANNKDLKAERNKFKEVATKFEGVDIEGLTAAQKKLSKLEKEQLEKKGEFETMHKNLQTQYSTDKSKWEQERSKLQSDLEMEIKTNALHNSLASVGVDPVLQEIAATSLIKEVSLDERNPVVGNKPVKDFVKEWSESDVGKRFILSGNTGGSASGNESGAAQAEAEWFNPKSPNHNLTKQGQLRKTNPDLAAKLEKRFSKKK